MRIPSSVRLLAFLSGGVLGAEPGKFISSYPRIKTFPWTAPTRTFAEAVEDAFPDGLKIPRFAESNFGSFGANGQAFTDWVDKELLGGKDPFSANEGRVPLPWPEGNDYDGDQVSPGHYVSFSRRQLCFIVAKSLIGATTDGFASGLKLYLEKTGAAGCLPRTGDFGRSLITFLETCHADPSLDGGAQGPLLIAAKASKAPEVETVREAARTTPLSKAGLRVCQYDDGTSQLKHLEVVPQSGCIQPVLDGSKAGPGADFMTGGLAGQATQDISAAFVGGYVYGNACGLGGGQDERLMTYMPEVGALAFFLSQEWEHPQLRQPVWILGARMMFDGLDGTARFNDRLHVRRETPFTSDLVNVELAGATYDVGSSRPFIAFMSENGGAFPWNERIEDTPLARRNKLPEQRIVSTASGFSFGHQVRAWYRSIVLTSYHEEVRPAIQSIVSSVGTGPWAAGLWWGDSQIGFLAVWLAHAVAAPSWGDGGAPLNLDYYIYSEFTENPGNQCFVHAWESCQACLQHCQEDPLPDSAYWMPREALFNGFTCPPFLEDCGMSGIDDIVNRYGGKSAGDLWADIEDTLERAGASISNTVFDELMDTPVITRALAAAVSLPSRAAFQV